MTLETYVMVKDYMYENGIQIDELLESMNFRKVCITVRCDGETEKFYSLPFAARYMGVSLPTIHYAHSKRSETMRRRKGGTKVFYVSWD